MSFAQYLRVFLQKNQPVFEAETPQVEEAPVETQAFDFNSIEEKITSKIGGSTNEKTDRATSFEALEQVLDEIGLDYLENPQNPHLDKIVELLTAKDRFDFLAEYINEKTGIAKKIISEIESIIAIKDSDKYVNLTESFMRVSERLLKLRLLLASQISQPNQTSAVEPVAEPTVEPVAEPTAESSPEKTDAEKSESKRFTNLSRAILESANIDDETREKIKKLLEELETTLKECTSRFNANTTKSINAIPNSPEGEDSLNKYKDLLVLMGLIGLFKKVLNNKDKEIKKEKPAETNDDVLRRKKRRLVDRLIRAIQYAKLPSISNNAITAQGDHFRLFKKLEEKNKSWMEDSLKNYVFNNNQQQYSEFGQSGQTAESPLEKDQIAYLRANNSWVRSYIESKETFLIVNPKTGETATVEFTQKEAEQLITKLVTAVTEKEKEIKNYYLSRDFNLGNFSGVQLTPEIRLPLNQKVKLPVTDADRKKESPLRNLFSGLGNIITGLFNAIPDNGNEMIAKRSRARNLAIMNGLNLIMRGTVALFGGKQAGRDYDEKVTSKLPGAEKKSVKEDMLSISDSPGAMVVNPEAPGVTMQVPASLPKNNMDTFALAGPLKKKPAAKKSKPKAKAKPALQKVSTRVSSFQDFMQRK